MNSTAAPIGQTLLKLGLISADQLHIALREQGRSGEVIGRQLVRLGFLSEATLRDALARTRAAWKPDPARGRVNLPTSPSGKGIREARDRLGGDADRGLLLLYTLTPYKGKAKTPENLIVPGWDKPIMAFAIAFPSAEHGIRVEYEVNLLYWMQEYGPSE